MAAKLLVFTICFAALHLAYGKVDEDYLKEVMAIKDTCRETHVISEEAAKDILNMKSKLEEEQEKCFAGCLLEGLGILKELVYVWENHLSSLPKVFKDEVQLEKASQVIKTCKAVNEKEHADKCHLGYEILSCIQEGAEKAGIIPPNKKAPDTE